MITETCRCGAKFEIRDGDKYFQAQQHDIFLKEHRVCREQKEPISTKLSTTPQSTGDESPQICPHYQKAWFNFDDGEKCIQHRCGCQGKLCT